MHLHLGGMGSGVPCVRHKREVLVALKLIQGE